MSALVTPAQSLNDVQLMLLQLFSRPMPNNDLEAIREMLLTYYETALNQEVERVTRSPTLFQNPNKTCWLGFPKPLPTILLDSVEVLPHTIHLATF
jgi:hypothetical protein